MTKKIVLIDDEVDLANLVKMRLEFNGYSVVLQHDSLAAYETVRTERPDIVLLDVTMPEKDGYEVCKELKSDTDLKSIPVIMFSARFSQSEEDRKCFAESGANDFLLKPFEPNDLLAKLKTVLGE